MDTFPNNLKRLRKLRSLKQEDLAERLSVTRQTVSGWETGRRQPDLDTLKLLAEALDADIYELIYGEKPGEYPKFQRKFVVRCWAFGLTMVLALLFWIFLMPVLRLITSNTYDMRYSSMAYIVPVLGWFSAGALLPNGLALVYQTELGGRWRKLCVIVGMVLVLPGLLVGMEFLIGCNFKEYYQPFTRLFYWFIIRIPGRMLLLMILPFISGILIFLGSNKE